MQFNLTTDYAIRTVLYLAIKGELATAKEIAEAMGIPSYYQLKITAKLVHSGIIRRMQGVKGGFSLNRKTTEITLFDIVDAMEPTMRINRCLEEDNYCSRFATASCPVRRFYVTMQGEIEDKLQTMTVAALLQQP
jgi:Rrf2 family nitric oxide-sensitive transcriptional repressor